MSSNGFVFVVSSRSGNDRCSLSSRPSVQVLHDKETIRGRSAHSDRAARYMIDTGVVRVGNCFAEDSPRNTLDYT